MTSGTTRSGLLGMTGASSVGQAVAVRVEGIVGGVAPVDRDLGHAPRQEWDSLPVAGCRRRERRRRRRPRCPGAMRRGSRRRRRGSSPGATAGPRRGRQPWDAGRVDGADGRHILGRERQVGAVAEALGVGRFADDNDADVRALAPEPSREYVTDAPPRTAARIPCRIVVPVVIAPLPPCHVIVQPPHWLPRSSAFRPARGSGESSSTGAGSVLVLQ